MSNAYHIRDLRRKIDGINKILELNIFNNPIREINENFRMDLIEFRELFLGNLNSLEKILVKRKIKLTIYLNKIKIYLIKFLFFFFIQNLGKK